MSASEPEKNYIKYLKTCKTLNGGSLGSWIDEERSKLRVDMWTAGHMNIDISNAHCALGNSVPGARLSEGRCLLVKFRTLVIFFRIANDWKKNLFNRRDKMMKASGRSPRKRRVPSFEMHDPEISLGNKTSSKKTDTYNSLEPPAAKAITSCFFYVPAIRCVLNRDPCYECTNVIIIRIEEGLPLVTLVVILICNVKRSRWKTYRG